MAAELLGAKMMAPYFGSSLYVWSAVMAVTLLGLATGYFMGGIYSEKKNPEKILYRVLVFAATFTVAMPFISKFAFLFFGKMNLEIAVTISSLLILFPPVMMMGMVSPLIIINISNYLSPGRAAGTVYAISTVGGILATFLYGFFIIPNFGLSTPALVTGIILGIIPLIKLIKLKDNFPTALLLILVLFSTYRLSAKTVEGPVKIVYSSEGLLGQIIVLDFPNEYYYNDPSKKGEYSRWLFVNRISQTMDDPTALKVKGHQRYFSYVHNIGIILDSFPKTQRKVLLLGLGGGSVAKFLSEKGFEVKVCELDARMEYVAREYFNLPREIHVTIDDARHFINNSEEKFDAIIFDTFKGEETPSHIFTSQSIEKIKSMLNRNGLMIVNTFGFIEGEEGKGTRSIFKTILESKMSVVAWPTSEDIYLRNIEFIASKNPNHPFNHPEFIHQDQINLNDAFVLNDDIPQFEIINAKAALTWRTLSIKNFRGSSFQRMIPIFE